MNNITLGIYLSKIKTNRAAVLPYIIKNNIHGESKIYFLVAIDKKSGDITDLGGGVKKNECSLIAALREFKEESKEIFEDIYDQINNLSTNLALVCNQMSVLFVPLEERWFELASQKFNSNKINKKTYNEVSELLWVDQDEFLDILEGKNREMWKRLRNFYKGNYNEDLLEALKITYRIK